MPRKPRSPKEYFEQTGKFKPGVASSTYRKDSAFARSRQAAKLFGLAAKCSKSIRESLAHLLETTRQKDMHNRLSHMIGKMIREQLAVNPVLHLNMLPWKKLDGFEFNDQKSLHLLLAGPIHISFDRKKNKVFIEIENFQASPAINSLKEATHLRILAAVAAIDFDKGNREVDYTASDHLVVYNGKSINICLSLDCSIKTGNPVFIVLGIACFQQLNKKMYELNNQRFQALQMIKVLHEPQIAELLQNKKTKRSARVSKRKPK